VDGPDCSSLPSMNRETDLIVIVPSLEPNAGNGSLAAAGAVLNRALMDPQPFEQAARVSPAFALELVDIYLEHAAAVLGELAPAVQAAVSGDVKHLAERLAGSSAACGMFSLVEPLRELEQLSGSREFASEQAEAILDRLQQLFQRVEEQLHAFCRSLPTLHPGWPQSHTGHGELREVCS
jgi:HPt (histidine-containing phosphotransfer) domain-containing protein